MGLNNQKSMGSTFVILLIFSRALQIYQYTFVLYLSSKYTPKILYQILFFLTSTI
jgi:hypothetical protein